MKKDNLLAKILLFVFFISSYHSYSTTYYSIANSGWTTPSTWSTVSCGGAAAITYPGVGDDVVICVGTTVTMNGNNEAACNSLTINGVANWAAVLTTNVGAGGITVNVGGNITGGFSGILTTTGGLTLNATLTSALVTIKTITTPGQTISGTGTLAKLDISANTTNNGIITVNSTLASTTASTLTQGAAGSLTYKGAAVIVPTLDASASGNTVTYGGTAQTVKSTTYHHLIISGSSTKTLGGAITVNGNLTVSAGELYTSTYQITGNASGSFTLAASTTLTLGNSGSATNVAFPLNFITANISLSSTSIVYYYGNSAQTVSSVPTYGSLRIMTFSGSKAADGDINIAGTLLVYSPSTLDMTSHTLNLSGAYGNTGGLSFTSGDFNITGSNTNTGSFTCGTGTVTYNGTTQTIKSTTYNNLVISGSGTKTLGGAITVNNNLTHSAGTLATSTYQITGNGVGILTLAAGTTLTIGSTGSATNVLFPTSYTNANISCSSTSTVTYQGNNAQTISTVPTYGNLTINTFSGSKVANGNITLAGNLVTTSPSTLSMTTYTLDVTGTYTGTGALSFSSGNFNLGGTFTNTGTFTCGTSTVTYNGGGAQAVRGVNYNNLVFSGAGTKTLQAAATIGIAGNFTRGTMTVTAGSTNTVNFNGTVQTMTGNATTFVNLTVASGTSLTVGGDISVGTTLTVTAPAVLAMTTNSLTVTTTFGGTGALSFTSGNFTNAGTWSNSGTFTCGTGTVTYSGGSGQTIKGKTYNNLIFSGAGTKTLEAANTITIGGDFTRGTMTVTPGATNTVSFTGAAQIMTGNATTFTNLTINNTSLTIPADITVNSTLTFTTGNIITGANTVILPAAGAVARTSGHVVGNLRKNVATGAGVSRTFEIGTGSDYTPITTLFASVSTGGNLTATTTSGDHAAIATSGFNAALTVNRYWTITNSAIVYTTYDATCTFVNADKDGGLNTSNCIIKTYNGAAWASPGVGTQGANSTQGITIAIPVTPNTIYLQIGENTGSSTGSVYSIANGNWNTAGTWSETSGGPSCGCTPTSLDNAIIENNFTVTMDANPGAAKSLTINTGGIASFASAYTTNIGSGGISIEATGDITGAAAGILTTSGGLTLNKNLTSTTVTIKTVTTSGQTISGTGTLAKLDISANTTNNGIITVTSTLASTIASTLTQGAAATLNYNGTTISPALDASAAGNTVNFGGANQNVKAGTYHHLTISGSSTKTLAGAITVNGNLTVSSGELYTSTHQITGNATGSFTLGASSTLTIGNNSSATNVAFPLNFITANISFSSTSIVYYYGNNSQTVSSVPTYGSLRVMTFSGSKAADGDINITGALLVYSPSTLDMSSHTLNLTGSYGNTGDLSFTSGNFNIAGSYTNTGAFTAGTGTVTYNGDAPQAIRGVNYKNLTFTGAGTKTLQTGATVGIAGDFARGTMTVTPGATNTVLFNGAAQVMTGNATTFTNLTINNSSLTIPADITVNSTLTFTAGNIITGASNVILPAAGSVARTSGHVIGNLRKNVATGAGVLRTFEIGTGADYTPLDITFASVSTGGNLTASTTSGDHPSIATSGFTTTLTVNRYWTLTNSAIVYTNYDVTCTFVDADKDAEVIISNCGIRVYDGAAWSTPSVGVRTANSTGATAITIPVTPNTVYLQIGEKACSSTGSMYSIATGNWTTPATWSETSGGAACSCYPSHFDDVTIENGFTVTMDGITAGANSLAINTGGIATWSSAVTTNVGAGGINIAATGDITGASAGILTTTGGLTLNNTLTSTTVTIKTITTAGQTISGTGTLANLETNVNTTISGNLTITDVLTVNSGTLTCSGSCVLKATALKYARLAPVGVGAAFAGNFTLECYLAARASNLWIDFSSPVNTIMQDWDDELFFLYPFTSYWSDRPEGTNVYPYDEVSALYVETNAAASLSVGKGFEIGLIDDAVTPSFTARTINSIGTPYYGDKVIDITYTAANGTCYNLGGYSGEILGGNPFGSAFQVDQMSFSGVVPSIDVLDAATGNYITLAGTDIIAPHQGFWAYTLADAPGTITFLEANKSTNTTTAIKSLKNKNPYLELTLSIADNSNTLAHTLKIACDANAKDGWDEKDHPFRSSPNKQAPSITAIGEYRPLSISTFNNNHDEYSMPLNVSVGIAGKYQINTTGIEFITNDFSCVSLEDKFTHVFTDLNSTTNYTFFATPSDLKDRFILHFSKTGNCNSMISSSAANLDNQIQILPNAIGNTINFNFDKTVNTTITITSVLGQTIINDINIDANTQSIQIALPKEFHGLYIIRIESEKGEVVKKFVKP